MPFDRKGWEAAFDSVLADITATPPTDQPTLNEIIDAIKLETRRAYTLHGTDQWGRHEFLGIIREEYKELEQAIFENHPDADMLAEAIEIAAMCIRFIQTGNRYSRESFRAGFDAMLARKQEKLAVAQRKASPERLAEVAKVAA